MKFMIASSRYISGAVEAPGYYPVAGAVTLAQLLAAAGGLTDNADLTRIEVVTQNIQNGRIVSGKIRRVNLSKTEAREVVLADRYSVNAPAYVNDVATGIVRLGGEVVSDAGDCTTLTHLITPAAGRSGEDDAGCLAKRTMKYVFAVAAGCAEVVRMDWVAASREADGWAAVDGFRVETDALAAAAGHPRGGPGRGREAARGERPKLLAGRSVRLHGTFRGKGEPSRRDLGRVAELLGAFLCEGPVRSEAATTGVPSLVVVCDQASAVRGGKRVSAGRGGRKRARGVEEEGKEEGNGQGAPPHVHWGWLLDCAGSYTLLPTAGYTVTLATE